MLTFSISFSSDNGPWDETHSQLIINTKFMWFRFSVFFSNIRLLSSFYKIFEVYISFSTVLIKMQLL